MNVRILPALLGMLLSMGSTPAIADIPEVIPEVEASKPKKKKPKVSYSPGKGFKIKTADDRYSLRIRARLQMLYIVDAHRSTDDPIELTHGFEIRRARLRFDGNLFDEHTRYKIALAVSPSDVGLEQDGTTSNAPLLAASVAFEHLRDLNVRIGQFAIAYNRQRNVSSRRLQFVERSDISRAMDFGYDLGFELSSEDLGGIDHLRYFAGIVFGEGRSLLGLTDFGMLYSARIEVFPLGIYKSYDYEGDERRSGKPHLGLGAAYAAEHLAPSNDETEPATNSHNVTGDLQFVFEGFSLDGSVLWRTERADRKATEALGLPVFEDENGRPINLGQESELGWHAQLGYVLGPVPLELAARYAERRPLGEGDPDDRRQEVGAALNWYIDGHPYKVQLDYLRSWKNEPVAAGDDQVRLQLQVSL